MGSQTLQQSYPASIKQGVQMLHHGMLHYSMLHHAVVHVLHELALQSAASCAAVVHWPVSIALNLQTDKSHACEVENSLLWFLN